MKTLERITTKLGPRFAAGREQFGGFEVAGFAALGIEQKLQEGESCDLRGELDGGCGTLASKPTQAESQRL